MRFKMTSAEYYRKQLNEIDLESKYCPSFVFTYSTGKTKEMNLNKESAQELIEFLKPIAERV